MSTEWKRTLQQLGFGGFVKRVERNSPDAYGEKRQHALLGVGGMLLMAGVISILMFYGTDSLLFLVMLPLSGLFLGLGIVIFGAGAVGWSPGRRRRPLGLGKKELTLTVTWLDLKAKGIESPGRILGFPFPLEYSGFGYKGITGSPARISVLRSIAKLGSEIPWSSEDARQLGSESSRYEAAGIVAGALTGVFILAMQYYLVTSIHLPLIADMLARVSVIMLLLGAFCLVFAVWQAVKWARTRSSDPPWLRGAMLGPDVQPLDTLTGLLRLLVAECKSPLRVLVLGDYPELAYTGRVFRTERGVELKEAVFVPSSGTE